MKKVLLVIASILMQVENAPLAYGANNYEHDGDIHTWQVSNPTGEQADFNAYVHPDSEVWDEFNEPEGRFVFGTSASNMYYATDWEELDSDGIATDRVTWLNPNTDYFVQYEVREGDGWSNDVYRNLYETPQFFNSGPSHRAQVTVSEPDSVSYRFTGPYHVLVEAPAFTNENYDVFLYVHVSGQQVHDQYLGIVESGDQMELDHMVIDVDPGESVYVEVRAVHYQFGASQDGNYRVSLEADTTEVEVFEPESYGSTFAIRGNLGYRGYDNLQWFEIRDENWNQIITQSPTDRGPWDGLVEETVMLNPGMYTIIMHAQSILGPVSDTLEYLAPDLTGIEDQEFANGITVYPNPSNGPINVRSARAASFTVTSVTGSLIEKGSLQAGKEKVLNLSSGIYMLSFYGDDVTAHQKLIVQ